MNRHPVATPTRIAALALLTSLAGCSSIENFLLGDKVDYRSQATKSKPLDVPPDLTQLARDARYQVQGGVVSASGQAGTSAGASTAAAAGGSLVAPVELGQMSVERSGNQRWLVVPLPPEKLWPQLRAFWVERGFKLAEDSPETGLMETDWAENKSKIPMDFVRSTLGRMFDSLYSSGERDRFRTRVERTAKGSEIFISHRGMEEVYSGERKESTVWQKRPTDPALESEMLTRLMVKLGAKEDVAAPLVASAPVQADRARLLGGEAAAQLQVDENFDRAWRRVGLALDRSGFTVEDRDRAAGLYYVRYVDPKFAGKEDPNFFQRLFSSGNNDGAPVKYRVLLKGAGDKTVISVQTSQGTPETGDAGKRIVSVLLNEMK